MIFIDYRRRKLIAHHYFQQDDVKKKKNYLNTNPPIDDSNDSLKSIDLILFLSRSLYQGLEPTGFSVTVTIIRFIYLTFSVPVI